MITYYTRRVMPNDVRSGMFIDTPNEKTGEIVRQRVKKVTPRACSKRGVHVEFEGSKLVACYSPHQKIRVTVTRKVEENGSTQGNAEASGRASKGRARGTGKAGEKTQQRRRKPAGSKGRSGSAGNGGKGTPRG